MQQQSSPKSPRPASSLSGLQLESRSAVIGVEVESLEHKAAFPGQKLNMWMKTVAGNSWTSGNPQILKGFDSHEVVPHTDPQRYVAKVSWKHLIHVDATAVVTHGVT